MNHIFLAITFLILLIACNNETATTEPNISITSTTKNIPQTTPPTYSIETFQHEQGWGYNIVNNGKPFIRQPNIPAVAGNKGFGSEEQAKKVGEYVLYKIQNGIMPPSISVAELDSLIAINLKI